MELYEYDYKKVENRYIKNIKSYEGQIDILENLVFIPKKDGSYPVNLTYKNFTIKGGTINEKYLQEYGNYEYVTKKARYCIHLYRETDWNGNSRQRLVIVRNPIDRTGEYSSIDFYDVHNIKSEEELKDLFTKRLNDLKDYLARDKARLKALPKVWKKLQSIDTMGLERYDIQHLLGA